MRTITLPPKAPENHVTHFVHSVTQAALEERIIEVLTRDIPELWRREHGDADKHDLPDGLLALVQDLENWCHLDFGDDDEES